MIGNLWDLSSHFTRCDTLLATAITELSSAWSRAVTMMSFSSFIFVSLLCWNSRLSLKGAGLKSFYWKRFDDLNAFVWGEYAGATRRTWPLWLIKMPSKLLEGGRLNPRTDVARRIRTRVANVKTATLMVRSSKSRACRINCMILCIWILSACVC